MWAITSYYNPVRYVSRLRNYRTFRDQLGVPLVTVELSYDGQFDLSADDADILIQLSGGAVLWQKERLLNIALQSVPTTATAVAWIDCDVIFERKEWAAEAKRKLADANVVQLFSDGIDLPRPAAPVPAERLDSVVRVPGVARLYETGGSLGLDPADARSKRRVVLPGMAWAARTEILRRHGFYDSMIVGGGDHSFVCAIYRQFDLIMDRMYLDAPRRAHYLKWARPFSDSIAGKVDCVSGTLHHLWHGDIENRKYIDRHKRLAEIGFSPDADLVIGPNGAWHWARPRPELEKFLKTYFVDRAEDG